MATFTGRPAVSGDDGDTRSGTFTTNRTYSGIGYFINDNLNLFVRVPNVTIPQGATISTAKGTMKAFSSRSANTVRVNIFMNDSDNAVAPTSEADHNGKARTTAFTEWDGEGAWVQDTSYDTPDFATAVKEVVDRGSWASGNAMMVFIDDDGSDNADRRLDMQDLGETTAFLLTIEYIPSGGRAYGKPIFW